MLSILYHDIGMLRTRRGHAGVSAILVGEEEGTFITGPKDRDLIKAIVASHSSSESIEQRCMMFEEDEIVRSHRVRPRLLAALVRLSDELDEDYRRADPKLETLLGIPASSRFYWRFCQRITAIQPRRNYRDIYVSVQFDESDVLAPVRIGNRQRTFVGAFADKLEKIKNELLYCNQFLPPELNYDHLTLSVKPLPAQERWVAARRFVFSHETKPQDFVAAFPELVADPAMAQMRRALEEMRDGDLDTRSQLSGHWRKSVPISRKSSHKRFHTNERAWRASWPRSGEGRLE